MKKVIKIVLIIASILFVANFLLNRFFFRTDLEEEPEITELKKSSFDFSSTKPFFFKVDKNLFYSPDGRLDYTGKPIWQGKIEEAYISPSSEYALIYNNNELSLIDNKGKEIFIIDDCTDLIEIEKNRKTGRFISSGIQWSKNSDFFLISQDRVWDKNYSNKNKTSIYKYSIASNSFKSFIDLNEELINDFF